MKKIFFAVFVLFFLCLGTLSAQKNASSQDYTTSFGVKFYPGAITLKHFIKSNAALEGIGYFWNRGTRFTGLYEFHHGIISVPGLQWYVGPGVHFGFYSSKYGGGSSVGIDGILGLDYKFKGAPINMSVDWQPSFEFRDEDDYGGFAGNWGGLSIRYVF